MTVDISSAVVGRDFIVQLGLHDTPASFRSRVEQFILSYLGTPDRPVPFGGRDQELAALNAWLTAPDRPRRLLLAAPAGRGKSALLVRWLTALNADVAVAFVPVSIRFGTNRAPVFFQALAARLAALLGERLPNAAGDPAEFYKDKVIEYLGRIGDERRSLLLVVDGLDEAAGWRLGPSALPADPGPTIRILISARLLVGDTGPEGWLRRLGWDRLGPLAETMLVPPLDRPGIVDVLKRMGRPLEALATHIDVVGELLRLTGGDPLLVGLYAEDLWEHQAAAPRLRPEDLTQLAPGFSGFFQRWLEEQEEAWNAEEAKFDRGLIEGILAALACALGPLVHADLNTVVSLAGQDNHIPTTQYLHPLRRFIIGDGKQQGYILTHPKLAEYLCTEYFRESAAIAKAREVFLLWGQKIVTELQTGVLPPSQVPSYLLQYYARHLKGASAPPDVFMALVREEWWSAWKAYEQGDSGFAHDVHTVLEAIQGATEPVADSRHRIERLAQRFKCALFLSSIASLGRQVSPPLLNACLEAGVLSLQQGFAIAASQSGAARCMSLAVLVKYVSEEKKSSVAAECLAELRSLDVHSYEKLRVIETIARDLPSSFLPELITIAAPEGEEKEFSSPIPLLTRLLAEQDPHMAQTEASRIKNPALRLEALAELPGFMESGSTPEEIDRAVQAVLSIAEPRTRAQALLRIGRVASRGSWRQQSWQQRATSILMKAIHTARLAGEPYLLTSGISALLSVERDHPEDHPEFDQMFDEALASIKKSTNDSFTREILSSLLWVARSWTHDWQQRESRAGLRERLLAASHSMPLPQRAMVQWNLATSLPPASRDRLRDEIFEEIASASSDDERAEALQEIASKLGDYDCSPGHKDAFLTLVKEIRSNIDRCKTLGRALYHVLNDDNAVSVLHEYIAWLHAISDGIEKDFLSVSFIGGIPERFLNAQPNLVRDLLKIALEIKNPGTRAEAALALLPHLDADAHESVLRDLLASAGRIGDGSERAGALADLGRNLPEELRRELVAQLIEEAKSISDVATRAYVLAKVSAALPDREHARSLVHGATEAALSIPDARTKGRLLLQMSWPLALRERPPLLEAAITAAEAAGDMETQVQALANLLGTVSRFRRPFLRRRLRAALPRVQGEARRHVFTSGILLHMRPQDRLRVVDEIFAEAQAEAARGYASGYVYTIANMADFMPADRREAALSYVQRFGTGQPLADALHLLADCFAEPRRSRLLDEALRVAKSLSHETLCYALTNLVWTLPSSKQLPVTEVILDNLAWLPRPQALEIVGGLGPRIGKLGGPKVVADFVKAVEEANLIWP